MKKYWLTYHCNLKKHLLNAGSSGASLLLLRSMCNILRCAILVMMFLKASCCSRTLMASVEFRRAAWWSGVVPSLFCAFMSATFFNNSTTYFLLLHDARWSAVHPSSSQMLIGITSSSISITFRIELLQWH